MKKEEGKMLEKQADDFEAAITKGIKETTMQHVKRYGRTSSLVCCKYGCIDTGIP